MPAILMFRSHLISYNLYIYFQKIILQFYYVSIIFLQFICSDFFWMLLTKSNAHLVKHCLGLPLWRLQLLPTAQRRLPHPAG